MNNNLSAIIALFKKNPLVMIGVVGILGAITFSFSRGQLPTVPANQLGLPASSPYAHAISGVGFIEASSGNIDVGSHTSGILAKRFVKEGDIVKANDPLFSLDTRKHAAQVLIDEAEVESLTHTVSAAKATYDHAADQHQRDQKLKTGVKSPQEIKKAQFDYQKAHAELNAQKAKLEQAKHKLALSKIELDRLTVKAPVPGIILKTYNYEGEYINEAGKMPVLTIGTHQPLYVRIQIDENDAWRYTPGAKGVGFLRSNSQISYPLTYVRFEPFAASKRQLSGDSIERVDTRIVEVIYKIEESPADKNKATLVIGQQMDVFIEASVGG